MGVIADAIKCSRRRESFKRERDREREIGRDCHLNNLFRGSSCLAPGGFLLSIYTVFLPIFESGSRFVVIGTRKVTIRNLVLLVLPSVGLVGRVY